MDKKYYLLLLFICITCSGFAQNFDFYYKQAAENHPALKAIFNEYYATLEQQEQVKKLPPPELAFGVFILPVETRLGAQRAKIGVRQMFPPIGELKAKEVLVESKADKKLQEAEIKRNQLYFELRYNWYELLLIEEQIKIIELQKNRLDILEALVLERIKVAQNSIADVYSIQLKQNDLDNQIALLNNEKIALTFNFKTLLNVKDSTPIVLPDSIPLRELSYNIDSLKIWINDQNPQLQLISFEQHILHKEKDLKATQNRPSFGVGLDYVWVTKRTDANPSANGRDIIMPMFSVKIPIYKSQNKAKIQEMDFKILASKNKQEDLENILAVELQNSISTYNAARLECNFYSKQIQLSKKILDVSIADFSVGLSTLEEVLAIENTLFSYERMLLESQIKQNLSIIKIEALFGQPL